MLDAYNETEEITEPDAMVKFHGVYYYECKGCKQDIDINGGHATTPCCDAFRAAFLTDSRKTQHATLITAAGGSPVASNPSKCSSKTVLESPQTFPHPGDQSPAS